MRWEYVGGDVVGDGIDRQTDSSRYRWRCGSAGAGDFPWVTCKL